MMPSFNSGFATDIRNMMEWRGTLGYTESCYTQQLKDFDRYCQKTFPDACILTWEISLSYLLMLIYNNQLRLYAKKMPKIFPRQSLGKYTLSI